MMVITGRGFYQGELQPLSLGIEDGVIREVRRTLRGDEQVDFGNRILLPGGIDIHVHFREPGFPQKEDFGSGTEGAAVSGITTVFDMPNTDPPATTATALAEKGARVEPKAHVDFGLYAGLEGASPPTGAAALCHAFKLYMVESFQGPSVASADLPPLLHALEGQGRPLSVHAEDPTAFRSGEASNLVEYRRLRPDGAEVTAIQHLIQAASETPIHIAHLSSRRGLDAVRSTALTAEVTPMHLLLDADASLGAWGKVNPPLRTAEDRQALWSAFAAGAIDILASDHAPHTPEEKADFPSALPGAPNVETLYPLLFHRVRHGELPLSVLVEALCAAPARLMGLRRKGEFAVGRDADLVVFDSRKTRRVKGAALHSKCGWSPFEGWEAIFPDATFLRGTRIAQEGELEASRTGRWLPRPEP